MFLSLHVVTITSLDNPKGRLNKLMGVLNVANYPWKYGPGLTVTSEIRNSYLRSAAEKGYPWL